MLPLLILLALSIGVFFVTRPLQHNQEQKKSFTPVLDSNSLKIPITVELVDPDTIKTKMSAEELIQLQKEINEYDSLERLKRIEGKKGAK